MPTRAPTRGAPTGGDRDGVSKCDVGGAHEGTHKGCPYGGERDGVSECNVGGAHEGTHEGCPYGG